MFGARPTHPVTQSVAFLRVGKFITELGGPLTPATFRKLFARAGERARLSRIARESYSASSTAGSDLLN